MTRITKVCAAALAVVVSFGSSVALAEVAPPSPRVQVEDAINEVVRIVEAMPGDSAKQARQAKLREVINPLFDFDEMSKRSLGSSWTQITPEEQKDFTEVFSNLLARTYLSKIETVKPGMVSVNSEDVELPKAVVKTIVTSKGDKFPIDYKLVFSQGKWKVYDVVIENIGLVANYRNEFAGIIRKDKFSGLMEKLRAKSA